AAVATGLERCREGILRRIRGQDPGNDQDRLLQDLAILEEEAGDRNEQQEHRHDRHQRLERDRRREIGRVGLLVSTNRPPHHATEHPSSLPVAGRRRREALRWPQHPLLVVFQCPEASIDARTDGDHRDPPRRKRRRSRPRRSCRFSGSGSASSTGALTTTSGVNVLHISTMTPFAKRNVSTPFAATGLPDGARPKNSPTCVPVSRTFATTLSPSASSSSGSILPSGNAARNCPTSCLKPESPCT